MLTATGADLAAVMILASLGVLMAPVPPGYVMALIGAVGAATLLLDGVKVPLLRRLAVS
jgi:hypothetical protein